MMMPLSEVAAPDHEGGGGGARQAGAAAGLNREGTKLVSTSFTSSTPG